MYPGQWGGRPDETAALKYKQIDSLRQYFPTVKEVNKEMLYEIPNLPLPNRQPLTLRLHLGPDFPRSPPMLQVYPPMTHSLLDNQMAVLPAAHPDLQRWGPQAALGKVAYEIIQKFMQNPPQIMVQQPQQQQPQQSYPPQYPPQHGGQAQGNTHTPLPVIPSSFPELDSKSPQELSQLLTDDREFQKFFDSMDLVRTMKDVRDALRKNVEDLSKKNLTKDVEIERARKDLASRHHIINEKRAAFEQKALKQQEIMKQFSTPALVQQLNDSANTVEQESDAIAQSFLNGDMDQKEFIKQFTEKRKLYHLRSAKKESLMMMMNRPV